MTALDTIEGKVCQAQQKQWSLEREDAEAELLRQTDLPEVSRMIRGAIARVLVATAADVPIQEIILEHRRSSPRGNREVKIKIEMLRRLKAMFNGKRTQALLASEQEFDREAGGRSREVFLFDCWRESWKDQQLSSWAREALKADPEPSFHEVLAAIAREPEMPTEFEDEPEEYEAFEHAAECNCGYGLQLFSEASREEVVSLDAIKEYRCEPIVILDHFEAKATSGNAEARDGKAALLEKMRGIQCQVKGGWNMLRMLVAQLSIDAFDVSSSPAQQLENLDGLSSNLFLIEYFVVHRLPFVFAAVSVQRFSRVYLSAFKEIGRRRHAIISKMKDEREAREEQILSELREYELPPGFLDELDSTRLRLAHESLAILERKLSDIRLISGYKRCTTRDQFREFLIHEAGIPHEQWRSHHWLVTGSRLPREKGGIGRSMRCIHALLLDDERFGGLPGFRAWMDGKEVGKLPFSQKIETIGEAEDMVRQICSIEGLADLRELLSDWNRFDELAKRYAGLDRAIILLSQD